MDAHQFTCSYPQTSTGHWIGPTWKTDKCTRSDRLCGKGPNFYKRCLVRNILHPGTLATPALQGENACCSLGMKRAAPAAFSTPMHQLWNVPHCPQFYMHCIGCDDLQDLRPSEWNGREAARTSIAASQVSGLGYYFITTSALNPCSVRTAPLSGKDYFCVDLL